MTAMTPAVGLKLLLVGGAGAALGCWMQSTRAEASVSDKADGRVFLQRVEVVPYSVLGDAMRGGKFVPGVGPPLNQHTAIVDPAGLPYVSGQQPPAAAGAASGSIYKWCGLSEADKFPLSVSSSVQSPGDAKHHAYGDKHVVHVVGPDFRSRPHSNLEGVQILGQVYSNVLREAAASGCQTIRLLPVSGGVFAGDFSADMHHLTMKALALGFENLSTELQSKVMKQDIKMCIFMLDNELGPMRRAHTFAAIASL